MQAEQQLAVAREDPLRVQVRVADAAVGADHERAVEDVLEHADDRCEGIVHHRGIDRLPVAR